MDGEDDFVKIWGKFLFLKQASSYATASSMALIVWEYIATFGQEIELVWCSRWSLSKAVYLLNRYITLLMALLYLISESSPTR
ncbi:hypothetical protein BDY19DRAFT_96547 [Irpex rosettiformis]|uniref:Uncharacterized protein n=1 Tax=Irpex rosettiformis TaxID=378272 RepID=A0ACB8U6W0_9APHY|nr:hypothetical protein BDY19DRAFT_96547 [Irpex rosettiformis]